MTTNITTEEEFAAHVAEIQARPDWKAPRAFALGAMIVYQNGDIRRELAVELRPVNFDASFGTAAVLHDVLGSLETGTRVLTGAEIAAIYERFTPFHGKPGHDNVATLELMTELGDGRDYCKYHRFYPILTVVSDLDDLPVSVGDIYLRLYLLSMRQVRPNCLNLNGIFPILNTAVFTPDGAYDPEVFDELVQTLDDSGLSSIVLCIDKFPRLVDMYVPAGVRIADVNRVRFGAFLGEGTTVMHEGFVNHNAGTEGPNMVEGRISQGVFVGAGSDIGGGASIMGTLSGGGKEVISIGRDCLLGANSGLGISLGDSCTVEAGLYLTAGMPLVLIEEDGSEVVKKARELSGQSNLLFRQHSLTGRVEALRQPNKVELNPDLHAN